MAYRPMKITLAAGTEAARLLRDRAFRAKWQDLYDRCPWATVFQTATFLDAWFEIYGDRYRPVLAIGSRTEGSLDGLLLLGSSTDSGEVLHAGTHHAEYQVWMAAPADGNLFIELTLDELARCFPKAGLRFIYLPPSAPLDWAAPGSRWGRCCDLVPVPVPLLGLADAKVLDSLRKKRLRKWKLEELEKMGGLRLEEIENPEYFASLFAEIIDYFDFRQGAVHDVLPFRRDARKKLLYLAIARVPGLLHISALYVGDRLVSACLYFQDRGRVIPFMLSHSPFLARYSPATLHILTLAARLAEQKSATDFDLTPGAGYKDRFATRHENSHIVIVSLDPSDADRRRRKQRLLEAARAILVKAGLESTAKFMASVMRAPAAHWAQFKAWLWSTVEISVYWLDADLTGAFGPSAGFRRDSLADLLRLRPSAAQAYLKTAFARIESHGHAYTLVQDGSPGCSLWTTPIQSQVLVPETGEEILLPPGSAAVYGFAATAHGADLYEAALRHAIHQEFSGSSDLRRVYTWVSAADRKRQVVLEKLGFVRAGTSRKVTRRGRIRNALNLA